MSQLSFTLHGILQTVKRNKQQYGLPLKIVSYEVSSLFWLLLLYDISLQFCIEVEWRIRLSLIKHMLICKNYSSSKAD